MRCTCAAHVVYMWCTQGAMHVRCACGVHAVFMRCTYAVYMHTRCTSTCGAHARAPRGWGW